MDKSIATFTTKLNRLEFMLLRKVANEVNNPSVLRLHPEEPYILSGDYSQCYELDKKKNEAFTVKLKGLSNTIVHAQRMITEKDSYDFYIENEVVASFPRENVEYAGSAVFIDH